MESIGSRTCKSNKLHFRGFRKVQKSSPFFPLPRTKEGAEWGKKIERKRNKKNRKQILRERKEKKERKKANDALDYLGSFAHSRLISSIFYFHFCIFIFYFEFPIFKLIIPASANKLFLYQQGPAGLIGNIRHI